MRKAWYKRWYVWVAIVVVLGAVGAAFESLQKNSTTYVEHTPSQPVSENTTKDSYSEAEEKTTEATDVSFSEKELYSGNDCTITLVDGNSEKLTFLYKNNSTKSRSFDVHSLAINGVMVEFMSLSAEIPAGSEAKKSFDIGDLWDQENYADMPVDNIQVNFWVYSDNYKEFETGVIGLNKNDSQHLTYEYEKSQTQSFSDVDVSCRSIEKSKVEIVVTNRTKSYITYDVKNIVINGWSFDLTDLLFSYHYPTYGETFSQCSSLWVLELRDDKMKENNINEIEKFECTLKIKPNGDYLKDFDTGTITFTKQ